MEREKVKEYNKTKIILEIFSTIINLITIFILGFTKIGNKLESISKITENTYISFVIYALLTIIILSLVNMPISFYGGYILEKKYELSNETIFKWIKKFIKSLLLMLIIGIFVMLFIYMFLVKTESMWWIFTFTFILLFNIILGMAAPIIIFPLFYKFTDIDDSNIKEKIGNMAEKAGVRIKGIYKFDMSKETKKANAAFTGIGKSKRIIIADNLLNNFTEGEILAVFAHEMGHYVKKHILKFMMLSSVTLLLLLFIVGILKFSNYNNFTNIFKISFYLLILQNITMIIDNWYSRKNEFEADNYSREIMGTGEHLISALKKLENINLADAEPNKIIEFIFYSHPSIKRRIENLRKK